MLRTLRTKILAAAVAIASMIVALVVTLPTASANADTTATPQFTASASTVQPGTSVTFSYAIPSDRASTSNWVGWYKPGQTPGTVGSTYWEYTQTGTQNYPPSGSAALTSGTVTFSTTGWTTGTYTVYLLYNDGYTVIGSPLTITIGTLGTPTATVALGAPVTFSYSAPSSQVAARNWIGLFLGKGCVSPSTHWLYTANSSTSAPSSAVATGTVTLNTAGWAAGTYSVCFLYDDGYGLIGGPLSLTVVNAALATSQTTAIVGTPVTLSYYAPADQVSKSNWIGWYRGASTCGVGSTYWKYTSNGTQTEPTTAVAAGTLTFSGMTVGTYTVCLLYNDGYTVIGSPLTIKIVPANQPVTVTASGNGTASASTTAGSLGQIVTLTETPAIGYHFTGWQVTSPTDGSVTIASDGTFNMPGVPVSVQANFAPDTETVHFDGNGADSGTMADQTITYGQPAALTVDGYARTGAEFAGWATSANGPVVYTDGQSITDQNPTDSASLTLYARWRGAGQKLVSFDSVAHGSASTAASSFTPGDTVTLSETPNTGYHFTGWQVDAPSGLTVSAANTFTMPADDVELTPQFAPNTYTVVYNGNGADWGTTAGSAMTYDVSASLTPNGFALDGNRFAGWSTTPSGPAAYDDQAIVSNLTAVDGATVTLYAQWTKLTVSPGAWSSLPKGFITETLKLPGLTVSGAVSQPLVGLWNGTAPTTFTKVSGSDWLTVTADGTVRGTAPRTAPQYGGEITVSATNGTTTSRILVELPVQAVHASPQFKSASWNAWQDGSKVTDAVGKNLAVIASQGIDVVGFQDGGYAMAQSIGSALGWAVHGGGDIGIVSAFSAVAPKTAPQVFPSDSVPAAALTISVDGLPVRVWDVHLDEANFGPYNACFNGITDPGTLVSYEKSTTRYAEATAVVRAMEKDIHSRTSVVMLGDLASPSSSDWTDATASTHCGVGAVAWPVPQLFTEAGLHDSYRTLNPNAAKDPGNTWSPVITTNANGKPEPQDRIDYVDYTTGGGLKAIESDTVTVGWPSSTDVAANSWASDHAAVVTTFDVNPGFWIHGWGTIPTALLTPTVTVSHDQIAYPVGSGPADSTTFLQAVGASTSPQATLSADLSGVDFTKAGWYTALVTASDLGMTSDPVAVTVRVDPAPSLTLGRSTATFTVGDSVTEPAVLAQLEPVLDAAGSVHVDLTKVRSTVAGSYPVTVTATDTWGVTTTATATVSVVVAAVTKS